MAVVVFGRELAPAAFQRERVTWDRCCFSLNEERTVWHACGVVACAI